MQDSQDYSTIKNGGQVEKIKDFSVEERLGEIVAEEMWGIVPYSLYRYQKELGLSIAEVWFLNWVMMHKWSVDDPFPSLNAMARYTGKSRTYIQNIARRLKEKGFLEI